MVKKIVFRIFSGNVLGYSENVSDARRAPKKSIFASYGGHRPLPWLSLQTPVFSIFHDFPADSTRHGAPSVRKWHSEGAGTVHDALRGVSCVQFGFCTVFRMFSQC